MVKDFIKQILELLGLLSLFRKARYRYREITIYLLNFLKPTPLEVTRLVIFAQGRTGSTLLESLLCSTKHFSKNGELLEPVNHEVLFPSAYINGLSKLSAPDNFIFHVKIYQLTRDRKKPKNPTFFLQELYKNKWKIIYIKRNNKIEHALSNIIAESRGDYHKLKDKKEAFKIQLDCDEFAKKVEERFSFDKEEEKALMNLEYYKVIYEDDLKNLEAQQKTIENILKYLALEPKKASTAHRKINTQPIKELIQNYDEFHQLLRKKNWLDFLPK